MTKSPIRVLVVDDYEPWHSFAAATFQREATLQIIGHVYDGADAVQQAKKLQPNLIVLDIGLPNLNGIEAARRIRGVSPGSKILFASENRSAEIVKEALSAGAAGYIVKSDAANELLPAVSAILAGKRFVSASLSGHNLTYRDDPQHDGIETTAPTQVKGTSRHHRVGFYSDDRYFLEHVTRFIEAALRAGNAAIVIATESHRKEGEHSEKVVPARTPRPSGDVPKECFSFRRMAG